MFHVRLGDPFVQIGEIVSEFPGNAEIGRLEQKHDQYEKRDNQLVEDSVLLNLAQPLNPGYSAEFFVAKQLVRGSRGRLGQTRGRCLSRLIERFKSR